MPTEYIPPRLVTSPSGEETGKGYTRAYFRHYKHTTCQRVMRLGHYQAERMAKDPTVITSVWCEHHRQYVPVAECVWVDFDAYTDPRKPGTATTDAVGT